MFADSIAIIIILCPSIGLLRITNYVELEEVTARAHTTTCTVTTMSGMLALGPGSATVEGNLIPKVQDPSPQHLDRVYRRKSLFLVKMRSSSRRGRCRTQRVNHIHQVDLSTMV
jgi:hypothetical protein